MNTSLAVLLAPATHGDIVADTLITVSVLLSVAMLAVAARHRRNNWLRGAAFNGGLLALAVVLLIVVPVVMEFVVPTARMTSVGGLMVALLYGAICTAAFLCSLVLGALLPPRPRNPAQS